MTEKTIILPPNPSGNGGDANYRLTVMVPKRRYFSYLRERWWVVVVVVAAAVAGMFAYQTFQPDVFQSTAQLYARGEMQVGVDNFYEDSQNYYGTQIELLKSARPHAAAMAKIDYKPQPGKRVRITLKSSSPGGLRSWRSRRPDPTRGPPSAFCRL